MVYNYCYWMVGHMAEDPNEIVRYTAIVRGVEAAGGAIASGISSTHAPVSVCHFVEPIAWTRPRSDFKVPVHSNRS